MDNPMKQQQSGPYYNTGHYPPMNPGFYISLLHSRITTHSFFKNSTQRQKLFF